MKRRRRTRPDAGTAFVAVLLALLMLALLAAPARGGGDRSRAAAHGRELLVEYSLPASMLEAYAAHRPAVALGPDAPRSQVAQAPSVAWLGPRQRAGRGHNPLNLVLTVHGVARAAGDVRSLWHVGWEFDEPGLQSTQRYALPLSNLARAKVAAGDTVTLTGTTGPVSFREVREVLPFIGMVQLDNFEVGDVRVQVWSGPAPTSWTLSWTPQAKVLLLTVLGLVAWSSWRGRPAEVRLPRSPDAAHARRVGASLHEVLHNGLSVQTLYDDTRPLREHAPRRGTPQVALKP